MSQRVLPSGNYLLFTGILLVLLGLGAIVSPAFAGSAVVYLIGGLLLITGLVQLLTGLREDSFRNKLAAVVLGAITGLAGIFVLAHPFYGLATLSLVLAIYFLIEGVWKIITSFSYRPATGWLALLVSGVLTLVLGWMIWKEWPLSGLWAVGVLVGVNLLFTGSALIALALTWKRTLNAVKEKVAPVAERIKAAKMRDE